MRNEAEAYRNDIVPRARGDAARIIAEAAGRQAGRDRGGDRPDAALRQRAGAYQAAKDVTLRRMYIETMQDILTPPPTLVVDDKLKGLVPFLPLNLPTSAAPGRRAARRRRPPPRPAPAARGARR